MREQYLKNKSNSKKPELHHFDPCELRCYLLLIMFHMVLIITFKVTCQMIDYVNWIMLFFFVKQLNVFRSGMYFLDNNGGSSDMTHNTNYNNSFDSSQIVLLFRYFCMILRINVQFCWLDIIFTIPSKTSPAIITTSIFVEWTKFVFQFNVAFNVIT